MAIDFTKDVLVLGREDDAPPGIIVPPGVGITNCDGCGRRCFISAESRKVKQAGVQVGCRRCVYEGWPADQTAVPVMTEGQLREAFEFDRQTRNN